MRGSTNHRCAKGAAAWFPPPLAGGGTGRGHPIASFSEHSPSPTLPRKRGREHTEFAARSVHFTRALLNNHEP